MITDYTSEMVKKSVDQLKADDIDAIEIACDIICQKAIARLVEFIKTQENKF